MIDFLFYALLTLFILVCVFLMLLILIQKGRGGGLAGAFGGGGGGQSAFGSKTGDVLTWATSIVFGVFLLLAILLNLVANHRHEVIRRATAIMPQQPEAPLLPQDQLPPGTEPASPTSQP